MSKHSSATGRDRDGPQLPSIETIRPRARTADGEPAVEIRFSNGASIRYWEAADGIREEWFGPRGVSESYSVDVPTAHDGNDDADAPATGRLADRALCTVASYLGFESRQRAAFAWGERNIEILTGVAGSPGGTE